MLIVAGLLLEALWPSPAAPADAHYTITRWDTDTEERLPQNSVISMTQTRDGYLWLGTGNGLARFDGIHFKTFDESELNSRKIVKLFEDSRTNLWIGTETGDVLLVKDGKVRRPDLGRGRSGGPLVSICEDSTGGVWLYKADGRICRYREGKVDVVLNNCLGVAADDAGLIWIGTRSGMLFAFGPIPATTAMALPERYELQIGKLDFLLASPRGGYWRLANGRIQKCKGDHVERDLGPYPWGETTPILAACEDREGNLVVGTYGEWAGWFDATGKYTQLRGLSHSSIFCLTVDREGSLWVGTDGGGLNRVKPQAFDVLQKDQVLTIQSVCEDAQGGLWFSINGGGVSYWKDGKLLKFTVRGGSANLNVPALFVDNKQTVWAGTFGEGLFQFQEETFRRASWPTNFNPYISAIFQDRHGVLWVGTRGGLARWDEQTWKLFTIRDGLPANPVQAIAEDSQGDIWAGTDGGGLACLHDSKWSSFSKTNGLPSNIVSSLAADSDGVLWVGTSSGLARFHAGKWTRYGKKEGLINNNVGYLLEDGKGYLWLGSTEGLMRIEKKTLNDFASQPTNAVLVRTYGQQDGLPTGECTFGSQPASCRARDGKLWFPTIKGLASIDPARLRPNTNPPPVIIEAVRIDGQLQNPDALRAAPPQAVTVPAGKESLEIDYTSLNLSSPKQGRFKYQLEPYEDRWTTQPGDIRSVRYPKLPHGDYRFHVMACNEDQVWNNAGSTLAVTVLPPFWQTTWFKIVTALCLLGILVGSVHYVSTQRLQQQLATLRQQEALEKERARIARDLHDQLGANLTQVALLGELAESDKGAPDEIAAHARQISQTARETTRALDEIVWTVNPSNDTLDGLINYICKYAQEYLAVAGLRYRLEAPTQLPATPISPELRHNFFLASKEAITNVVRHAKASAASIRLRLEPSRFTLEIEDDGRGVANLDTNAAQSRNGLRNMRKRMEDVGGEFSIGPAPAGGTMVRLSAPLRSGGDGKDA